MKLPINVFKPIVMIPVLSALLSGCIHCPPTKNDANGSKIDNSTQTTFIPADFFWDSGEQQCEIASKKIVYHFWIVPSADPTYQWEIKYAVKTEKNSGTGWQNDNNLYSVYYFFSYSGGRPNDTSTKYLNNAQSSQDTLVRGKGYPTFTNRVMTVNAGGGSHGIEVTWPNSSGCQFS